MKPRVDLELKLKDLEQDAIDYLSIELNTAPHTPSYYRIANTIRFLNDKVERFEQAWPMLADGVRAVISSAPFIVYRKDGQPGQVEFASDYGWTVWRSLESQDPEGWPVAVDECYSKKENIPQEITDE